MRLKSHIKTPKNINTSRIIRRAERALLNERVRIINNSINMLSTQKDTCKIQLKEKIGEEIMEESEMFIKTRKETRHFKTMSSQKRKFQTLCQKNSSQKGDRSNTIQSSNTVKLVPGRGGHSNQNINIRSDHSDVQCRAGIQYVAAVEQACTKLEEGKTDEFRVQVKVTNQKIQKPKPNITKEEKIALTKLKKDPSRMVLTADKGMALVIMNTEDYKKKAEDLSEQHTYRPMASDPTMLLKNKLTTFLKSIKAKGGIKEKLYKRLYPQVQDHPNSMGFQRSTRLGCH